MTQFSPLQPAAVALPGRAGATVPSDAKLGAMAREFEATFLSLLLKEMRQTLDPDGGLFAGDSGDVQGGLFDLYLGKHLADAGGVGFAANLVRQLHAPDARPGPAAPRTPPG